MMLSFLTVIESGIDCLSVRYGSQHYKDSIFFIILSQRNPFHILESRKPDIGFNMLFPDCFFP
jgi:hypothetical protein